MQTNETDPTLPTTKTIVVFFGMTASGKSTLGMAWAEASGAAYHNTDRVRKELAGVQPTDRCPDQVAGGIYAPAFTERTYRALLDRAEKDLAQGCKMVVLDGSYSRRRDRDQVRVLARKIGAQCVFIFCTCGDTEVRRRLVRRAGDSTAVSDGRWEIYLHQQKTFEMPDPLIEKTCINLDTEQGVEVTLTWLSAHPLLRESCRP